jgi:hypothetical protein
MNQIPASDKTETLWHVGQGIFLWSPDPDAMNFIRCSRRRATPPSTTIHVPNCKTPNTTAATDVIVTRKSVEHRPLDTNLTGSTDRQDKQATCPTMPPVKGTSRWRKSGGKLFRHDAISSTKQGLKEALGLSYLRARAENLGSPPPLVVGAADGGGRDQRQCR